MSFAACFSVLESSMRAILQSGHTAFTLSRSFYLSLSFHGVYPVEIIAAALRMFGQGTKVCVEVATMAADAGMIPSGEPVIVVGGTGQGADTALILKAANSCRILDTKIEEIICKPLL